MPRKQKSPQPLSIARRRAVAIEHSPSGDIEQLVAALGSLIEAARTRALAAVNVEMVLLHWQLGRHIVEFEQGGVARAAYGSSLIDT